MKLRMFSVRDDKAGSFGRPFFMPTAQMAIRSFGQEVNRSDENNMMYLHPEDFDLYEIGEFDDEVGLVVPITPMLLECAVSLRDVGKSYGGTV